MKTAAGNFTSATSRRTTFDFRVPDKTNFEDGLWLSTFAVDWTDEDELHTHDLKRMAFLARFFWQMVCHYRPTYILTPTCAMYNLNYGVLIGEELDGTEQTSGHEAPRERIDPS